mgnify:CR=1 FL=1
MRHLSSLVLALGIGCAVFDGSVFAPSALSRTTSDVALKLRRSPGRLDVVINGLGMNARAVSQRSTNDRWTARLTDVDLGDGPFIPQQVLFEASELLSVRLEPLDGDLQLVVKARIGETVPMPKISSDGDNLIVTFTGLAGPTTRSLGRLDLRSPGRVPQPAAVPPMRPRAVAPPLGDMAVGTMLISNRNFVQASGPPVTLTLNNAPAKDALMSMARLGGYGFLFVADGAGSFSNSEFGGGGRDYPVTMAFKSERYDRALNSVLMASGLQGRLDGNTLLVGTAVSAKSFGPQMSKVFRLNQVDVESAAEYLASLGASMTAVKTVKITSGDSASSGSSDINAKTSQSTADIRETETYGSSTGPLLGLSGVTDDRLDTVTLVGDPVLISVAQSYLRQLDLRKRQVAVKVQILNVSLNNDKSVDASFSARMGDTYIVSQSGKAHMNFGRYKPGNSSGTGIYEDGEYGTPGAYQTNVAGVQQHQVIDPLVEGKTLVAPMVDQQVVIQPIEAGGSPTLIPVYDSSGQPIKVPSTDLSAQPTLVPMIDQNGQSVYVPSTNPTATPTLKPVIDQYGRPVYVPGRDPSKFRHPDDSFFAYIESLIVSSSAKTLAQPTLLVQEGETAEVETGENIITGVSSTETANGSTQFENSRENAGLSVEVEVSKIDDNGFVTLNLSPEISVPVPAGIQRGVPIFNIAARKLSSGNVRLRDGQSLILTGVITESDRQQVRKWPILGDMPLIGQLFRQSASSREKNELVVIVTPMVLDDEQGGRFGYGYRPGTTAGRQLMQSGL